MDDVLSPRPERLEFDGAAGTLVADRWPADGDRRGVAVLLHGGGQTRHSWSRTSLALAAAGWESIAVDARGHGESDWAPDADYTRDALVADLRTVLAQIGEPAVLLGASMGGLTSLVAEGEHAGTARALVLVDVVPRLEAAGVERIVAFMEANAGGFATLDDAAAAVRAYNPRRKRPANPEGLRKNLRRRGGRWYWHWDPAFLAQPDAVRRGAEYARTVAAVRAVRIPTLLLRGAESDVVGDEGVQELLDLIPGSRHADVPAAGHMIAGDDNDVFTRSVLEFLASEAIPAARS